MKPILFFIINICYIHVFAQDSISRKSNIHFGIETDYGKWFTWMNENEKKWEVGSWIYGNKWMTRINFGYAAFYPTQEYQNVNYQSEGNYISVSSGYKQNVSDKSRLAILALWGISRFEDSGNIQLESPSTLNNDFDLPFSRNQLKSKWIGLQLHSETDLKKKWSVGFQIEWRRQMDLPKSIPIDPLYIIGYGKTYSLSVWAINGIVGFKIK